MNFLILLSSQQLEGDCHVGFRPPRNDCFKGFLMLGLVFFGYEFILVRFKKIDPCDKAGS